MIALSILTAVLLLAGSALALYGAFQFAEEAEAQLRNKHGQALDVSTVGARGGEGPAQRAATLRVQAGRQNGDTARPDAEELCVVSGQGPGIGSMPHVHAGGSRTDPRCPAASLANRASVSTLAALKRGRVSTVEASEGADRGRR